MATPSPSSTPSASDPGASPAPSSPSPSPSGSDSPTPSPSPGSDPAPSGGKPSDRLPSAAQRAGELAALKTPPPGNSVGFDVRPSHLYYVSYLMRDQQFSYAEYAKKVLAALDGHQQAAGKGEGANALAAAYRKVADRLLEVWAKSAVSIGGAAVGLTVTANNYAVADWLSNQRTVKAPPAKKNPPEVIGRAPDYGSVPDIKWYGTDHDSTSGIVRALGEVPDFLADLIEPAINKGLNLGRLPEITPGAGAFKDELIAISACWQSVSVAVETIGDNLIKLTGYLTDQGNGEWQSAMNAFCQTIWGTTAWGKSRNGQNWGTAPATAPGDRRPILEVLSTTALALASACVKLLAAGQAVTAVSEPAAVNAAKAMVADMAKDFTTPSWDDLLKLVPVVNAGVILAKMVTSFRSHMDSGSINAAIDTYHSTCHDLAKELLDLLPALDEAFLSAPTFRAEEARAEAFGARSLNEFKHENPWGNKEDAAKGIYKVDLASQEWLNGGHTLDKHTGKTDEQLAQRLRDQGGPATPSWPHGKPSVGGASTFETAAKAQELTQYNIDHNSEKIKKWLDGPPSPTNGSLPEAFESTAPDGQDSGRSVTKQPNPENNSGFKNDGINAQAIPVKRIRTVLKYDDTLIPPFVVLTSMPTA